MPQLFTVQHLALYMRNDKCGKSQDSEALVHKDMGKVVPCCTFIPQAS